MVTEVMPDPWGLYPSRKTFLLNVFVKEALGAQPPALPGLPYFTVITITTRKKNTGRVKSYT